MLSLGPGNNIRIGLALSGGGVRAVAFHAGVLKWFAEKGLLEHVLHISSVSGGSLYTGLVFHTSGYSWPTSVQYLEKTLPEIRKIITTTSLQCDAILRLIFQPTNWRFLLSRADVVAKSIEHLWGIRERLKRLPASPVWSINGTTAENGRRFRFKNTELGDYEIGYAAAPDYKLASAMAVSAAFPGGIGPLTIETTEYVWRKRKNWGGAQPADIVVPKFRKLHLYDGGVYDNLGIEPLFDVGKQIIKNDNGEKIDFLVVSDAGAPFTRCEIPGPLNLGRLQRVAEVAFDQTRALRVRALVNFLNVQIGSGMYLQIGSDPIKNIGMYAEQSVVESMQYSCNWLSSAEVSSALAYKTTLSRMTEADFDLLVTHGYETSLWNEKVFLQNHRNEK